jgi:hypothetical protein
VEAAAFGVLVVGAPAVTEALVPTGAGVLLVVRDLHTAPCRQ